MKTMKNLKENDLVSFCVFMTMMSVAGVLVYNILLNL